MLLATLGSGGMPTCVHAGRYPSRLISVSAKVDTAFLPSVKNANQWRFYEKTKGKFFIFMEFSGTPLGK